MKAYKGFNKDMTCKGFKFEEGKTYEEEEASLCRRGFHACENPIDVFRYYAPGESVYHKVDIDGVSPEHKKYDSKVCGKKIRIGAAISLRDMIRAGVKMDIEIAAKNVKISATSGDSSHAATSGKDSIAAAIGRNSKAKSSIGNWLVLAEYGKWNGNTYPVLCVKCAKIDGENLKPDTWYKLQNGEFVEVLGNEVD